MTELHEIKVLVAKIAEKQDEQCMEQKNQGKKLDRLHIVLGGDEFSKGLVSELNILKSSHYRTKGTVDKVTWLASILGAISGAIIYLISKIFEK